MKTQGNIILTTLSPVFLILFLCIAYVAGTGFGYWQGLAKGRISGVEATIDQLIETGYLKFRGHKNNPEIVKHDEE